MKFFDIFSRATGQPERSHPWTQDELANQVSAYLHFSHSLQEYKGILTSTFLAEVSQYECDLHTVSRPDLGVGGAFAFYGRRMSPDELHVHTQKTFGADIPNLHAGGFDESYVLTGDFSDEQWLLVQKILARDLVRESLQAFSTANQLVPEFLLCAASLPILPYFQYELATAIGIKRPDAVGPVYARACDSAGSAFYDLLSGIYDTRLLELYPRLADSNSDGALVTIFIDEDGWRLSNEAGDASSQFFSTGAGALTVRYHPNNPSKCSFVLVSGTQHEVTKGTECLRYIDTTKKWTQAAKETIVYPPNMVPPDEGKALQMSLLKTAKFFIENNVELLEAQIEKLAQWLQSLNLEQKKVWYELLHNVKNPPDDQVESFFSDTATKEHAAQLISTVAMHHPSPDLGKLLVEAVQGGKARRPNQLKYSAEQFPWLLSSGNAPALMMVAAFLLIVENESFDQARIVQTDSYGAGGSFTTQLLFTGKMAEKLGLTTDQLAPKRKKL